MQSGLNGMFNIDGLYQFLGGRDSHSILMVFSYFCAFMDMAIGYRGSGRLTKMNISYFKLVLELQWDVGTVEETELNCSCH